MRLNWLHFVIIILVAFVGIDSYIHSAQGKMLVFSVYGSSLVRPKETAELVNQLGLEVTGPISEGSFEWNEVERAYYWVCYNIAYEPDVDGTAVEFVGGKWTIYENDRMASSTETLEKRAGDCEDQAILLCSILRQAGAPSENVRVVLGIFKNETAEVGHSWCELAMEEGYWQILDPTALRIFGVQGNYGGIMWFNDSGWGEL